MERKKEEKKHRDLKIDGLSFPLCKVVFFSSFFFSSLAGFAYAIECVCVSVYACVCLSLIY